jgi:hypothetical protein
VNAPLIVAGSLGLLAAAVHGAGGELLLVRKLSLAMLPSSPFGDAKMTKLIIHVNWHLTTIAFITAGAALILSGSVLNGDAARAVGVIAASAFTGFALVAFALALAYTRSLRFVVQHPAPVLLTATAALAWWGAL